MPILYVAIFFMGLIFYMAVFLIFMKKTIDCCTAYLENIEKHYPDFYSENRPSMTRSGHKRKLLAEFSESGYVPYRFLIWRLFFPTTRSDAAKAEYREIKQGLAYKDLKRIVLLHGSFSLAVMIAFWVWGKYYFLPALAGV